MINLKTFSMTLLLGLIVFQIPVYPQQKKVLDHSVYDGWNEIQNAVISNNGRYVSFEFNPQKGDGHLVLFDTKTKVYDTIPRGYKPAFGPRSDLLVLNIKPQYDTMRSAKLKKLKKDKLPKDSLGIRVIGEPGFIKFPKLKSYALPEEPSGWIAVLVENAAVGKQKSDTTKQESDTTKQEKKKNSKAKKKKDETGTLILFNPFTGDSSAYSDVSKFAFSKNGHACAFIQVANDSIDSVSVHIFDTRLKTSTLLTKEKGFSENISIDETGEQVAYTHSSDTSKNKPYALYYRHLDLAAPVLVQSDQFTYRDEDWSVSPNGKIYFNEKGNELYFGTAPRPEPEITDTLTEDEKVSLDIWNWKDPYLQPQQLKQLDKEKKRSYAAVFFSQSGKTVQLGNPEMENVMIDAKAGGNYSIGTSNVPYRREVSWDASRYKDVYLVDRTTGKAEKILAKVASTVSLSPTQNHVLWYNISDSCWYSYATDAKSSKNLTEQIEVAFYNELDDVPDEAGPYGMAGWTTEGQPVVYDRYDLWMLDPAGNKAPVNLSSGAGRKGHKKFRYLKLEKDSVYLPEEMLLHAFDEKTRQAGYYALKLKNRMPRELIFGDYYFNRPVKAKDADKMIWRKESFSLYPDLYVSTTEAKHIIKVSEANPQQNEYNWGTTELVSWVSFEGDSVEGILVKPENFDPQKKYPMLVYFYERSTDRLNRHYAPKPIRSVINWTYYASNDYLVFVPDIKYKTGYPGPDAYNYVVSGTQAMCNRFSFIDRENLGIQGQSWGGYQAAYIITQTDMFKAAMAGAPVSNMTSAYGGIRWESGMSRAFQYEESQSRIGATLWERRDLYILNSPIFFADRVNTPLLIMHNDNDGAVPWYQGIELFNALRRLDKPVWMLVYNKAPHNLKRRADMEDLTVRMQQFFDHYLKGAPEPVWMKTGIPAIDKGRAFGLEME